MVTQVSLGKISVPLFLLCCLATAVMDTRMIPLLCDNYSTKILKVGKQNLFHPFHSFCMEVLIMIILKFILASNLLEKSPNSDESEIQVTADPQQE